MSTGTIDACVTELVHHLTTTDDGAVVLHGEPGTGKTAVLERVAVVLEHDHHRGRIHCITADATVAPLAGIGAVASAMVLSPDPIRALLEEAEAVDRPEGVAGGADLAAELLTQVRPLDAVDAGLHAGLDRAVRRDPARGAVVLLDDADRLDHRSRAALTHLVGRLTGTGVHLVLTVTGGARGGPWRSLPHVGMPSMSASQTLAHARSAAGEGADPAVVATVAAAAAGSRATVDEHLVQLSSRQLEGTDPLTLPLRPSAACTEAVLRSLASLADEQRTMLDALASAPQLHPGRMRISADSWDVITDLVALGVVERRGPAVAIRDGRVRAVLYWSMPARRRRVLHATVSAQYDDGDRLRSRWHAALADPGRTTTADLLAFALALLEDGDPDAAVETAEFALGRLGTPTGRNGEALLELVAAFVRRGRLSWARRYLRLTGTLGVTVDRRARVTALEIACDTVAGSTAADPVVAGGVDALVEDEPEVGSRLLTMMAVGHGILGDAAAAEDEGRRALALLGRVDPATVERYEDAEDAVAGLAGRQRGGPVTRPWDGLPPCLLLMLGQRAAREDAYAGSRTLFTLADHAGAASSPVLAHTARLLTAELEVSVGHHGAALRRLEHVFAEPTDEVFVTLRWVLGTWYWLVRGQPETAEECATRARRAAPLRHEHAVSARLAAMQGEFALMRGEPAEALAHLRHALHTDGSPVDAAHVRMDLDHLDALAAVGEVDSARTAFPAARDRIARLHTRWSQLALLRAQAIVAKDAGTLLYPQGLLRGFSASEHSFDLARAMISWADRLQAVGDAAQARVRLLAARSIMADLGATGWRRAIDDRLNGGAAQPAAPVASPVLHRLTPDERRVVDGLLDGRRNKEIAASLFVSVRTVETRLTSVYRKLGVTSRAHLMAVLTQGQVDDDATSVIAVGPAATAAAAGAATAATVTDLPGARLRRL